MGRWPPMRTSFPSPGRRRATPESRWCSSSRTRRGQAHDAAALVRVDYEPRPAAIGFEQALAVGCAPRLGRSAGQRVLRVGGRRRRRRRGGVRPRRARHARGGRQQPDRPGVHGAALGRRGVRPGHIPLDAPGRMPVGPRHARRSRPRAWGSGPSGCASSCPTPAVASAPAAACTRSTRCSWLPPGGWGDPSSGRPSARRRSWPITRRAITCCAASWPSTATADSRRCARASTGATAPI